MTNEYKITLLREELSVLANNIRFLMDLKIPYAVDGEVSISLTTAKKFLEDANRIETWLITL